MLQLVDLVAAGEGPGQVAVGLDRLADERQQILRENPLADLAVEVLVLVEGEDQRRPSVPEGIVAGREQAGQASQVLRAGFGGRPPGQAPRRDSPSRATRDSSETNASASASRS